MGARFLDEDARTAFKQAIETIEATSGVEVVIAVRRRSAGYLHANLIVGAVVAFASLAAMLFSSYTFSLTSILFDPFVVGAIAGGLVELLPGVKRVLTPPRVRHQHVSHGARAAFVDRGVHNTVDRSGLLVYISWLEQDVALVADSGLERALTLDVLHDLEEQLTRAMPRGGVAFGEALAKLAPRLGTAMPRREGDLNELPDTIDSDVHRSLS